MASGAANIGEMDAFVRAAMRQSFSEAARELDVTPSAVSKLVSRLEKRLGVRLFNRTTRRLHLTPEGETFLSRSQRILIDIEDAEAEILAAAAQPRGLLRMHSTVAFAQYQLATTMREFGARYPDIQVELSVSDTVFDLIEEGADLSVRIGSLPDSTLVARRIGSYERIVCASPAYLLSFGHPRRPADLREHNCLTFAGSPELRRWRFHDRGPGDAARTGPVVELEMKGRFSSNNADMLLQWCLNGTGIARLPDLMVGPSIRAGDLVPLLGDDHVTEKVPVWAVCPSGRQVAPRVQAMIGFLVERFADSPWQLIRGEGVTMLNQAQAPDPVQTRTKGRRSGQKRARPGEDPASRGPG